MNLLVLFMKIFIGIILVGIISIFLLLKLTEPQKSSPIQNDNSESTQTQNSTQKTTDLVFYKLQREDIKKQSLENNNATSKIKCTTDLDCKTKNPKVIVLHEVMLKSTNQKDDDPLEIHHESQQENNPLETAKFSADNINQIISESENTELKKKRAQLTNSDELLDLIDNLAAIQESMDNNPQNNR